MKSCRIFLMLISSCVLASGKQEIIELQQIPAPNHTFNLFLESLTASPQRSLCYGAFEWDLIHSGQYEEFFHVLSSEILEMGRYGNANLKDYITITIKNRLACWDIPTIPRANLSAVLFSLGELVEHDEDKKRFLNKECIDDCFPAVLYAATSNVKTTGLFNQREEARQLLQDGFVGCYSDLFHVPFKSDLDLTEIITSLNPEDTEQYYNSLRIMNETITDTI